MRADAGETLARESRQLGVDLAARRQQCEELEASLDGEVAHLRSLVARAGALPAARATPRPEAAAPSSGAEPRAPADEAPAPAAPAAGLLELGELERLESEQFDGDWSSPDAVGAAVWALGRDVVRALTPRGSCVAVAGRGEETIAGRRTLAVSTDALADDEGALAEIRRLQTSGAEYLLIASTSTELRRLGEHLGERLDSAFELVTRRPGFIVHRLAGPRAAALAAAMRPARPAAEIRADQIAAPLAALVSSMLPADAPVVWLGDGEPELGRPTTACTRGPSGRPIPFEAAHGLEIAIALDAARRAGASHLVIPSFSHDRFERCRELVHYVARRCRPRALRPQVGSLFELRDPSST